MNKFIYMLGLVLLTGCSEKISNFTIDNVVKSNEKLNFSINSKYNKALDKVRESSSKKLFVMIVLITTKSWIPI
ncbi:hypothetical protein D3C71_962720 [compost metagenome]